MSKIYQASCVIILIGGDFSANKVNDRSYSLNFPQMYHTLTWRVIGKYRALILVPTTNFKFARLCDKMGILYLDVSRRKADFQCNMATMIHLPTLAFNKTRMGTWHMNLPETEKKRKLVYKMENLATTRQVESLDSMRWNKKERAKNLDCMYSG